MQTAQQWARKELRYKHQEEHKELYSKLKEPAPGAKYTPSLGTKSRSRAWCKATTKLIEKYREEYNTLRDKAIKLGYPNDRKY